MSIIGKLLNRPPKPDEFAKDLGRRFKDAGLADLAYSSEGFFFRQESASRSVFLDNVYRNYCAAARGEREEIVRDFVQAFVTVVDVPADFASARAKLMPVLRDYRYASLSRLSLQERGATETPDWPALPFASE